MASCSPKKHRDNLYARLAVRLQPLHLLQYQSVLVDAPDTQTEDEIHEATIAAVEEGESSEAGLNAHERAQIEQLA